METFDIEQRRLLDQSYADQKKKDQSNSDFFGAVHGAANAKDAVTLRKLLAQSKGNAALEGETQNIYNQSIGDAEATEKAAQEAEQRKLDVANSKNAMMNQAGDSARTQLAQKLGQVRSSANSRGLLYSGLRQGAEGGARAQSAGALAGKRSEINNASDEQMTGLTNQAAQQGIQTYGNQIKNNAQDYQDALARYKQKSGALGALGQGLGALGGALPI